MSGNKTSFRRRKKPVLAKVPREAVRAYESHHSADFEMTSGRWKFHKICWIAQGSGYIVFSRNRVKIKKNEFVILPANELHQIVDDPHEPLSLVFICVDEHLTESKSKLSAIWEQLSHSKIFFHPFSSKSSFHQNTLIEEFRTALREQSRKQIGWELSLISLCQLMLIHFARGDWIKNEKDALNSLTAVKGAIDYLNIHFYKSHRVDELAGQCGLSPRRFTDLFKQATGQTLTYYLNSLRIKHAQEKLTQARHILYACYESGFNDPAYFYRVFKKHTGITPGGFLESLRKE